MHGRGRSVELCCLEEEESRRRNEKRTRVESEGEATPLFFLFEVGLVSVGLTRQKNSLFSVAGIEKSGERGPFFFSTATLAHARAHARAHSHARRPFFALLGGASGVALVFVFVFSVFFSAVDVDAAADCGKSRRSDAPPSCRAGRGTLFLCFASISTCT